jgi:phospholipid/cholesterol/gamma-HCH transport system ATP-binding protein
MIAFEQVHKAFEDHVVLTGFSLEIPSGETTVIIGASGSGKSVALKHVVGLLDADYGRVLVDGEDVAQLDREELIALRRRIGFVFQSAALFDSLTVEENIAMGLARRGFDRETIEDRIEWSLEAVKLFDVSPDRMPAELSGGQKKRVGIARAIAPHPEYLLYDEPTTGLDPMNAAIMSDLINDIREATGTTSVVVTHDMRTAFTVADRIAMLYQGRIQQVGTTDEIRFTEDATVRAFVEGRASGEDITNMPTAMHQVPRQAPGA